MIALTEDVQRLPQCFSHSDLFPHRLHWTVLSRQDRFHVLQQSLPSVNETALHSLAQVTCHLNVYTKKALYIVFLSSTRMNLINYSMILKKEVMYFMDDRTIYIDSIIL
jgi:hypothetical protein